MSDNMNENETANKNTPDNEQNKEFGPMLSVSISLTELDGSCSVIEFAWRMPNDEPNLLQLQMISSAMALKDNFIYLMNSAHGEENSSVTTYDVSKDEMNMIDKAIGENFTENPVPVDPLQAFMNAANNRS